MKIAIFGKFINPEFTPNLIELFSRLKNENIEMCFYKPFHELIYNTIAGLKIDCSFFTTPKEAPKDVDFLITIGGDGTFLESMPYLKSSDIPVIGINSGRLGYLANIGKDEISMAFNAIVNNDFKIEKRALLRIESDIKLFGGYNFALNEVTIQKTDSSLISIDTWIDDEFLNTYWTDGLIISTPTGSTAYSLSVGGPIVVPGSKNFILAPIASHTLSVRPIVIPEDVKIRMVVKSRSGKFLVTADNRTHELNLKHPELFVRKTKFTLKMLKLPFNNYYSTLRNKLMWGMDKRN